MINDMRNNAKQPELEYPLLCVLANVPTFPPLFFQRLGATKQSEHSISNQAEAHPPELPGAVEIRPRMMGL